MHIPKDIYVYGDRKFRGRCAVEKQESVAFFGWLRAQHPELGKVAIHIRNELERRDTKVPAWIKSRQRRQEGLVVGASDIIIPCNPAISGSQACVIEMKRRDHTKSTLSDEQEQYLLACKKGGAFVCIALGAEAAMDAVGRWIELSKKLELKHEQGLSL